MKLISRELHLDTFPFLSHEKLMLGGWYPGWLDHFHHMAEKEANQRGKQARETRGPQKNHPNLYSLPFEQLHLSSCVP